MTENVMAEMMEVDTPRDTDNKGSQLKKRSNLDEERLQSLLSDLDGLISELFNKETQLLDHFKKYKTHALRMRHFYKYAVDNKQLPCLRPTKIEFWYFWTWDEAKLHIELEEHLSSCSLITPESSVDSVMEKLDMKSAELKKFDQFPEQLIRSCVQRRILHKKWLDIKRTMKAYVEKTVYLYLSEDKPTEDLFTYVDKRNPLTGLELDPENHSRLSLVEKLAQVTPSFRYDINEDIYAIIREYQWEYQCSKQIEKLKLLPQIEDYCEDFIKNMKSYILDSWPSGDLYCLVHKEVTRQKQNMENSVEDSEDKGTYDDSEWLHKEIQMVIERNESDEYVKEHPKSFFDVAMSRWQSLLQEGNTHFSNKATKSSHFAKPHLSGIVERTEDLVQRLLKATSEINSVINVIIDRIEWLCFWADNLENIVGKVLNTSEEDFEIEDDEKYIPDQEAFIQ